MNTILLTAGVVALMAAVIGGGLKAFNIELPVLQSRAVRIALGGLGIVFLIAAFVLREDDNGGAGGDPAVKRYQSQVVAACNAVRNNRASFGTPKPDPDPSSIDFIFDRDRVVMAVRDTLQANRRRLGLLFDKPPDALRDEAKAAREHYDDYAKETRAFSSTVARELPEAPTYDQIAAVTAPLNDRANAATAPLEDSLTRLADRECSLTRSS